MAQECGFFNAQLVGEEYDRVYLAEQFAAYFASFIGNGIFGKSMQQLEVMANNDMTTKVLSGQAWANGWWYRNTTEYNLTHSIADGVLSRIDVIVVRWDNIERDMYLHVIEGTPSANPIKPDIVRNADYFDLQLAAVSIPAGSVRITQSQITDTRLDTSVCGLVTGVVDQIDTTSLYNQFETYFREWKENQQADYENWTTEKMAEYVTWITTNQSDFLQWFDEMKDQLSEDAAGHLQLEIDELREKIVDIKLVHFLLSYDPQLAGTTITVSNDEESYTVIATDEGHSVVDGMSLGLWTIQTDDEGQGIIITVDTTYYGNYEVEIRTTTPYNYQGWLDSASITKTFASLDEILADEITLRELFTKHASVNYLVEWIEGDNTEGEKIFNTDLVAKWINLRDYALDTLYASEAIANIMDEADKYFYGEWALIDGVWQAKDAVPIMTSDTAPYGTVTYNTYWDDWYGYKVFDGNADTFWAGDARYRDEAYVVYTFVNPIKIRRIKIDHRRNSEDSNLKVSVSADGTTFTEPIITTRSDGVRKTETWNVDTGYVKAVKIYTNEHTQGIIVHEAQFYGRSLNVSIPAMTSNTNPFGVASGNTQEDAMRPWNAFDRDSNTQWRTGGATSAILQYMFSSPIDIRKICLTCTSYSAGGDVISIQGSTDGINFAEIGSFTVPSAKKTIVLNVNAPNIKAVKLVKSNTSASLGIRLYEMQCYGLDYSEREFAEGSTMKYLYDHGVDVETVTKTTTSVLANVDTTAYKLLRATVGQYARTNDTIKCGSGSATLTTAMMPNNCCLDISSINGTNQTGFSSVANTSDISCWLE